MFFPLMFHDELNGFIELVYLPSNNWENKLNLEINMYALYSDSSVWNVVELPRIKYGESVRYSQSDFSKYDVTSKLVLMYPSLDLLPKTLPKLPGAKFWHSSMPAWRNSTGFVNQFAQVSYQAEIEPFPAKASLLTFHPFIQFDNMQNNLITVNITSDPAINSHSLKVFNSLTSELLDTVVIESNSTCEIKLDKYMFKPTDLPVFSCETMAAIPFGLGISKDNYTLSLEHTHPPASLVIFGDRRHIQSQLKKKWFNRLGNRG